MELNDYLNIMRRSWVWIVVVTLVTTALGGLWTLSRTPVYQSSAQLFVSPRMGDESLSAVSQGTDSATRLIKSYVGIVGTDVVLRPLSEELGDGLTPEALRTMVSAEVIPDTVLVKISARNADPKTAAVIANEASQVFTTVIRDQLEAVGMGQSQRIVIEVAQPAMVPASPISPNAGRNIALSILLGLFIGFGSAVLREVVDTRVRTREDVEAATELPVLGGIVYDPTASTHPLIVLDDPNGPRSEAYRALRMNLQFLSVEGNPRSFVVTSAGPSEGKSTTAANLSIILAEGGSTVCIVDGDLRKPRVAELFGTEGGVGLADVLIGRTPLDHALQQWGHENLKVLPAGHKAPNPSELLGSPEMGELIDELQKRFDFVIIDSPPLVLVTDAAVTTKHASGALLVAAAGQTKRDALGYAVQAMDGIDARLLGTVMTMVPATGPYAQGYSSYVYSDDSARTGLGARLLGGGKGKHNAADSSISDLEGYPSKS